jgi:hypothetical protein
MCPCNSRLFLFSTVKNVIKGSKSQTVDVRRKVTAELNVISFGAVDDLCEAVMKMQRARQSKETAWKGNTAAFLLFRLFL